MPATTPTNEAVASPARNMPGVTCAGNFINFSTVDVSAVPITTPATPPTVVMSRDCTRKWMNMSKPLAPSAMRVPISRTRSTTLASRMLAMTTPPVNREMTPTIMKMKSKRRKNSVPSAMSSVERSNEKSLTRWRRNSTSLTSLMAVSRCSGSVASRVSHTSLSSPANRLRAVVSGMYARRLRYSNAFPLQAAK